MFYLSPQRRHAFVTTPDGKLSKKRLRLLLYLDIIIPFLFFTGRSSDIAHSDKAQESSVLWPIIAPFYALYRMTILHCSVINTIHKMDRKFRKYGWIEAITIHLPCFLIGIVTHFIPKLIWYSCFFIISYPIFLLNNHKKWGSKEQTRAYKFYGFFSIALILVGGFACCAVSGGFGCIALMLLFLPHCLAHSPMLFSHIGHSIAKTIKATLCLSVVSGALSCIANGVKKIVQCCCKWYHRKQVLKGNKSNLVNKKSKKQERHRHHEHLRVVGKRGICSEQIERKLSQNTSKERLLSNNLKNSQSVRKRYCDILRPNSGSNSSLYGSSTEDDTHLSEEKYEIDDNFITLGNIPSELSTS